jgi:omega-hydroxy-beta-dihydromenaquinone-9 sulfotransferase
MFFDVRTLAKGLWISLFKRRFSLRRWAFTLFFTGLFLAIFCFNAFGRLLDHVLFWRFKRQPIREPLFIIANPRSGTTLLHRLMALDTERFQVIKLYQTLFPSIAHQKVLRGLAWLDSKTGRLLGRLVGVLDRKLFGGWDGVHPMGFTRPEEDEAVLIFTLLTGGIYVLFPWVDELDPAIAFGDLLPERRRRKLMHYYRTSMQRHLWLNGQGKTMLSKNVLFSGRFESVLQTFPDARVIYLVRHPYEAVPSFISMFYTVWRAHSRDLPKDSPESHALGRVLMRFYTYTHEKRGLFPPERFVTLRYDDLVADPRGAVGRLYEHFGLPMSDAFLARLDAATRRTGDYKSGHDYSLEEFGLTREEVQAELGEILDHYGFER